MIQYYEQIKKGKLERKGEGNEEDDSFCGPDGLKIKCHACTAIAIH